MVCTHQFHYAFCKCNAFYRSSNWNNWENVCILINNKKNHFKCNLNCFRTAAFGQSITDSKENDSTNVLNQLSMKNTEDLLVSTGQTWVFASCHFHMLLFLLNSCTSPGIEQNRFFLKVLVWQKQSEHLGALKAAISGVNTCKEAMEVAVHINHTERCGPQAQHGLNALKPWTCGYTLWVRLGQAAK